MKLKKTLWSIALGVVVLLPLLAYSESTVIISTTAYPGTSQVKTSVSAVSLPRPGVYVFDLVADSTAAATSWTSLQVYLQQEGLSRGAFYTIANSTFTACTGPCAQFVYPDVYLGGRVRAQWTLSGSSASFTVTAREVTP